MLSTYTFTPLVSFERSNNQASPNGGLIADSNGNLYGTTYTGDGTATFGTVFEISGGLPQTLAVFDGNNGSSGSVPGDGPENPNGAVIFDGGNLYGVSEHGGLYGYGTVWELSGGTLTTVASFNGFGAGADGSNPFGSLLLLNGELLGTTSGGGDLSLNSGEGDGTIFEVAPGPDAAITTLVNFEGTNGASPQSGLVDLGGTVYGSTFYGGDLSLNSGMGYGTIFTLTGTGLNTVNTLITFNGANGGDPTSDPILATDGNLYGTVEFGGTDQDGVVYELAPGSSVNDIINFGANFNTGISPQGALIQDSAGDLFGTTADYGAEGGNGTVFELTAGTHVLNVLYTFPASGAEGGSPDGALYMDGSGNLYGATDTDGAGNAGTLFELSPSGGAPPPTFATLTGGALVVNGTSGDDTIALTTNGSTLTATLNGVNSPFALASVTSIDVEAGAGNDTVTLGSGVPGASVQGGPGDDSIVGGAGADTLGGGTGNDTILGDAGNDSIRGGAGDDTLGGGQGDDSILGSLGNDTITGGAGNDILIGGAGSNVVHGGLGDDTIFAINGAADTLYGGAGNDTAHIDQGLDQIPNNDIETVLFT